MACWDVGLNLGVKFCWGCRNISVRLKPTYPPLVRNVNVTSAHNLLCTVLSRNNNYHEAMNNEEDGWQRARWKRKQWRKSLQKAATEGGVMTMEHEKILYGAAPASADASDQIKITIL